MRSVQRLDEHPADRDPATLVDLGHLVGFGIDDQALITELILEHGHMWTKRMVAIPGAAIDRFETDELTLSMTSDRVGGLKSLPGHHRWG